MSDFDTSAGTLLRAERASGDAATIAELAAAAATPTPADPVRPGIVVVPDGATVEVVDTEHLAPRPRRATGTVQHATVDSFVAFIERHATEHTTAWIHPSDGTAVAVIDDHLGAVELDGETDEDVAVALPGWGEHRAELALEHTPEWLAWIDGQGLTTQQAFAEHIEANAPEIREPAAAEMLDIAQHFHATIGGTFRKVQRLADGSVSVEYDEQVDAKAGKSGNLTIPTEFTLAIRPFVGLDPYKVTARLRYLARGGSLQIGYQLQRPEDVVRDALDGVRERVAAALPRTYVGTPR